VARDNISVGVITIDRIPGEGMPVLTTTPDAITGAVAARGVPRRGQRQPQANARRPLIPLVLGAVAITIVIGVSAMLLAATDDRIGGGGVGTGLAGTGTDTPPRTPTQSVEELATGSSSSSDTKTKRPEGGTESNRSGGANLLAKGSETPATSSRRSAPEADGSSKVVSPPAGSEQRGAVVQQVNPTPPPTPPSASAREDRPPPPPVAPRGSNADSAARAVQLNAVTDSIRRKSNEKSQLQRQLAEIEKQITKVDKEDPSGDQKRKLGKLNTDKSAASDRLKSVEAELGRLEERKKQLGGA